MRFDDSLSTVLAGDTSTAFGREAAWRQLVDLLGRGRIGDVAGGIERLSAWRGGVPLAVRVASGRALAFASPPAALVGLFAGDELAASAPVLRTAMLAADDWLALLPALTPAARAVLRHRRDLPPAVRRGLESFGATDFVLSDDRPAAAVPAHAAPPLEAAPPPVAPRLPPEVAPAPPEPRFEIADLVARIDAFQRARPETEEPLTPQTETDEFHFVTDDAGVIRWVEGIARGALIGVSLAHGFRQGIATVAPAAAEALRTRVAFGPVALTLDGAAGTWRLWGAPRFDRASGRFAGMGGVGRRTPAAAPPAADQLRQLTHELRTPANAIAGFAELIGTELLGPVPALYRDRARLIEGEAGAVVAAIDDLDAAARAQGGALDLRPAPLDLAALARRAVADLAPDVAALDVELEVTGVATIALADDRVTERLLARLLHAAVVQAGRGDRIAVTVGADDRGAVVTIAARALVAPPAHDALLSLAAESEREGAPLLGLGFTLRLATALATALGGSLGGAPGRLTLRLPAAQVAEVQRAVQ